MHFAIPTRLLAALIATSTTVILLAACGGAKDTSSDPLTVGGTDETVVMKDTAYKPGNLQVPAGATITFTNEDGARHDAKADDGSWETDDLGKSDTDTIAMDVPGEYTYFCEFHPNMKAKITVVAAE